jgi:hypothetical protein
VISIRPSRPHAYINSNMYTRTPFRSMFLFQQRLHHYLGPHTSARACPDRQAHRRAPSVPRQIYKPLPFTLLQERRAASPQGLRLSVLKKEDRKSVLRYPHAHPTVGLGQVTQCSSSGLEYRIRVVSGSVWRLCVAPCWKELRTEDCFCPRSPTGR